MKALSEKKVQSLSAKEAYHWLFGVEDYSKVSAGERPSFELDFDKEIQKLIDRRTNKNAKIQLAMDEAAIRRMFALSDDNSELCPFFVARHLLWRSLVEANRVLASASAAQKRVVEIDNLRSTASTLRRKIRALSDFDLRKLFDNPYNLDGSSFEADELTMNLIIIESLNGDLERLLPELSNCLGNLDKYSSAEIKRLSPTSNRGDIWRQAFVEGTGYSWRLLTGSDPARSGPFQDFAEAAYYSVGGSNSLDRTIRTVLDNVAKRPEDDRFDRDCIQHAPEIDGYVPKALHRDGQRVVQRAAVWAPYFFDPHLSNESFEPFGEEAEEVQTARRRRLYGDHWTEDTT